MKTTVDYLRFRTRSNPFEVLESLRRGFGSVGELLSLGDQGKGVDGWTWRRPLFITDIKVGAVDYGGDHMREWVRLDMPGEGCEWVQDWSAIANLVEVLREASLKRLDLALTTYAGQVTHEAVLEAHGRGEFSTGGRHPDYREIKGSDPRAGRTIYVGKREAWKYLRCYEKGWQLLKDCPASFRNEILTIAVDGVGHVDPSLMYRVEVEFKDKDKVIPWTAITDRDSYFAGAYPFCASLLPMATPRKCTGLPDFGTQMTLQRSIDNARRSYGGLVKLLYELHGQDAQKVVDVLMAEKPAQNLIDAGVLTLQKVI
jgi:phage replication initiation protein